MAVKLNSKEVLKLLYTQQTSGEVVSCQLKGDAELDNEVKEGNVLEVEPQAGLGINHRIFWFHQKVAEFPKPIVIISKLSNKNNFIMNIIIDQSKPFWLVLEWKTNDGEQSEMAELNGKQILDKGQAKIHTK